MITEKDVRRFISQSSDMVIEFVHGREYVKMFDETGRPVRLTLLTDVLQELRREMHCDLSLVYTDPGSLDVIYKCNECGTVIYTNDEYYDPNLVCPVCDPRYAHKVKYDKTGTLDKVYEKSYRHYKFEEDRIKRRGKFDWELFKYEFYWFHKHIKWSFIVDDLYGHHFPLRGLRFVIQSYDPDSDSYNYHQLPLSIHFIKELRAGRRKKQENLDSQIDEVLKLFE